MNTALRPEEKERGGEGDFISDHKMVIKLLCSTERSQYTNIQQCIKNNILTGLIFKSHFTTGILFTFFKIIGVILITVIPLCLAFTSSCILSFNSIQTAFASAFFVCSIKLLQDY